MEANTGPLLKVYYENCPGCKQDRKNEVRRGVPYREFFYIWIVTLCSALPVASLFPFLYFMTQDLHVAKREEDIGFYAGFVGSAFMIGRVLTSVFWGIVADRYGRKPVIVISIISVILFNTMFGLSTSYWMALVSRLLLGCFNGLLGPIRVSAQLVFKIQIAYDSLMPYFLIGSLMWNSTQAYASEVCRKEYQALGLSLVSSTRGIGLIVGPAIGGFFAQPAKKYPNIFSIKSLFGRFPYFLPCFCISLIATGALVACFWLPETLHMHDKWEIEDLEDSLIRCETKKYNDEIEGTMLASKQSLIKNRPLMSAIIVYCAFALQDTAYAEIFSLWAVSNKTYGGLSFSSQEVGEVLAISGLSLLVYQLFLYPCFEKYLGPISSLRAAAIFSIPLLTSYPFMSKLSGLKLFFVVNCASLLKSAISVTITTGFNILQNNAVSQHQRGAANGVSVTALSLSKAIAPATAGALFSWAQKRQQASFLSGITCFSLKRCLIAKASIIHQILQKSIIFCLIPNICHVN
ncbi:probable peptide/nitrate transporter At3g43790 isoform X1 [Musa acuminata AAA Group]|uniref:probable peptide/nitrate transporter At3g43790 isoform X1 n=1 Tax=Musa acuminata AAA Group TaxID=214697 RepID=UPI0031D555F0